ncbi:hypothetical protein ACB098_07G170300 [Castanea mollissima]
MKLVANIIFIDAPVGAGFSYATTSEGYYTSDTKSAQKSYTFLRKWLLDHPQFLGNQLYIGGDSCSGLIVPMLVKHVLEGLEAGLRPRMQLQAAKYICHEDYVNYSINNTLRVTALQAECLLQINLAQILEPQCAYASGKPKEVEWNLRVQELKTMNYLLLETKLPELQCRGFTYVLAYKWLNDDIVRKALHVREMWGVKESKQAFGTLGSNKEGQSVLD